MFCLATLLLVAPVTLAAPCPAGRQGDEADTKKAPDPARVEEVCKALDHAYAKGSAAEQVRAIEASFQVLDAKVIGRVAKGLRSKEREVQVAALEVLRWMRHPEALDELHDCYARNRTLRKDEELVVRLLKAIGQHASVKSIKILSDDPYGTPDHRALEARILGLGRIRDPRSVESLIAMMNKGGSRSGQGRGPAMNEFRLALTVLTGADAGPTRDGWIRWWNDHKKKLKVDPELPELSKLDLIKWRSYWNLKPDKEQRERRKREREGKRGGSRP